MAQEVTDQRRSTIFTLLALIAAALIIRAQTLGHPLLHMDENFYLLVGDRMLRDGAWPYVDIWDRKPLGLFALFAAMRALGGDGFWQYQLVALACVVATAWAIVRIAQRAVPLFPALIGGVMYIAGLTFFGGYGGQAPVYYNLLMASAALIMVRTLTDLEAPPSLFHQGARVMLLVGVAIQLKSSVVFEGLFFGIALLFAGRHTTVARLALWAVGWAAIALLPTFCAWAIYAAAGHGDAFVFANFLSIFKRTSSFDAMAQKRLLSLLGLMSPFLILSLVAWKARARTLTRFAFGWLGFAFLGLLMLGTFYNHYGLALLVPLSVTAAIGLGALNWRRTALCVAAGIVLATGTIGTYVKLKRKGDAQDLTAILALYQPHAKSCPWFLGTLGATLYIKSGACLPTRYPLSGHLFERQEARAIGADQTTEIAAIMAQKPPMITMDVTPRPEENLGQRQRFIASLSADYALARTVIAGQTGVMVFVRKEKEQTEP